MTRQHILSPREFSNFSIAYFLGILILMIFASPFVEHSRIGAIIESVLVTLVLLSAVSIVGGRLRMLIALILMVPALVGHWLSYFLPHLPFPELFRLFGLMFLGFVVIQFLRYIVRAPRIDLRFYAQVLRPTYYWDYSGHFAYVLLHLVTQARRCGPLTSEVH